MGNEWTNRAEEIRNLPARRIAPGGSMGKKAAEDVVRSFPTMKNDNDGRRVIFPVSVVGKILGHKGYNLSRIIRDIPDLYNTSLLGWPEPEILKDGHKAHPNIKGYYQYINKFTDGDGEYYIRFTITEVTAKPGRTAKNLIHSAAVSDITIYEKGGHSQHDRVIDPGEASPPPFVDRKLQEFLDPS